MIYDQLNIIFNNFFLIQLYSCILYKLSYFPVVEKILEKKNIKRKPWGQ